MDGQPQGETVTPDGVFEAGARPLVDRAARNPFYRYLMFLGVPISVSLFVHVALVVLLAIKTFQVLVRPGLEVGEYSAGLTESLADQMKDALQWGEPVSPDEPPVDMSADSFANLLTPPSVPDTRLRDLRAGEGGGGSGAGDGVGLGIGDGALTVLGMGGGGQDAAPGTGGFGGGLGDGSGRFGHAGVWGLRIHANKVIYVVDFSGSILGVVDALKSELKRSIGRLQPTQSFNVITFYGDFEGASVGSFRPQLEPATEAVRREFFAWIEQQSPRGRTFPLAAIKRALALKPDAIFLFSDGDFSEPERDEAEIIRLAKDQRVRIYCLVFDELYLTDGSGVAPKDREGILRLKRISEATGAKAKIVTAQDLRP